MTNELKTRIELMLDTEDLSTKDKAEEALKKYDLTKTDLLNYKEIYLSTRVVEQKRYVPKELECVAPEKEFKMSKEEIDKAHKEFWEGYHKQNNDLGL